MVTFGCFRRVLLVNSLGTKTLRSKFVLPSSYRFGLTKNSFDSGQYLPVSTRTKTGSMQREVGKLSMDEHRKAGLHEQRSFYLWISACCSGRSFGRRPPIRPCLRALSRPTLVRSRSIIVQTRQKRRDHLHHHSSSRSRSVDGLR